MVTSLMTATPRIAVRKLALLTDRKRRGHLLRGGVLRYATRGGQWIGFNVNSRSLDLHIIVLFLTVVAASDSR